METTSPSLHCSGLARPGLIACWDLWSQGTDPPLPPYSRGGEPAVLLTPLSPCFPQEVEQFSFITQLAGCSDHVAVGLRLLLNPAPQ